MKTEKRLIRWTFALVLLGFVIAAVLLALMPARVPAHYNAAGEIDRIGSKYEYLLLPCFSALFCGLFLVLARYLGKKEAGNARTLLICNLAMSAAFAAMNAVLMLKALRAQPFSEIDPAKISAIVLGVLLIVLGNFMPKTTRNAAFGLRTTWSTKNDAVWQRCQRFGGFTGVAVGLLIVLLSCFLEGAAITAAMLFLIVLWTFVCILASRKIYRKWEAEQDNNR